MWRSIAALLLAAVGLAACGPAPRGEFAAVQPADIAAALCQKAHPGDDAACRDVRLPDQTSTRACQTCLDYHRLDPKACNGLRLAYESELRAYFSPRPVGPIRTDSPADHPPPAAAQHGQVPYQTAAALYKATSSDAQTFTAALLIPEVRHKVEEALRQSLSDERLHQLAEQAKSESLYWYGYLQRLERSAGN